jgi:hypothetical protein
MPNDVSNKSSITEPSPSIHDTAKRQRPPQEPHHPPRGHPPHHNPPHHRHHHGPVDQIVATLQMLVDAGVCRTVEEIAAKADGCGSDGLDASEFLRGECLDLDGDLRLAIDKLSVWRREERHRRYGHVLRLAQSGRTALVPPLPPYMLKDLLTLPSTDVALSDEIHHVPPHLQELLGSRSQARGFEAATILRGADLIIFDAYRDGAGIWLRQSISTLLIAARTDVVFAVHFRPHLHSAEDILAPPGLLGPVVAI